MQGKNVYYAHSKLIYDTDRETEELKYIESMFKTVCCPNRDMCELGSMDPYLDMVEHCDIVVCSEYEEHVGRGVCEEIQRALWIDKKVFCLRKYKGKFILRTVVSVKIVDERDWRYYYGKLRVKLLR